MYSVVEKSFGKVVALSDTLETAFLNLDLIKQRDSIIRSNIPSWLKSQIPVVEYDVIDDDGRSYVYV